MRKLLHLHHHRHTGKVLHHRHTSYRSLFVILTLAGACMLFTQQVARADDLVVTATIPAPIPSGAPVFTSPADQSVTENSTTNFTGTCPVVTPAVIIAIYEGTSMIGSSPCYPDGTFAVSAAFQPGPHTVVATVKTITGDTGASSAPLTITYQPKSTTVVPTDPTTPPSPNPGTPSPQEPEKVPSVNEPLEIIADKPYVNFGQYSPASWQGVFKGGTRPYTVTIDWGDGYAVDVFNDVSDEHQTYSHFYVSQGPFTMRVTLKDANGTTIWREYGAVSLSIYSTGTSDDGTLTGSFMTFSALYDIIIYCIYLTCLLTTLLLWRVEQYRLAMVPIAHFYKLFHPHTKGASRPRHH